MERVKYAHTDICKVESEIDGSSLEELVNQLSVEGIDPQRKIIILAQIAQDATEGIKVVMEELEHIC